MSVERRDIMTQIAFTRRQLAQIAFVGAAGALLPAAASAQQTAGIAPMPVRITASDEGPFLAECVPLSAGYALTDTQTKEVSVALQDYPGPFAKARAFPMPSTVSPSWTSSLPPEVSDKGRGK